MDTVFFEGSRIQDLRQSSVSRQQEIYFLEKNGKASSSKRTKHINIRYFFITNRVAQGDVSLVWCPTGDMIGYFMTKPIQGALFRKFRDHIMGVIPAQDTEPGKSQPGKAQTGNAQPGKGKPKKGKEYSFLKFDPAGRAAPQECVGRS